MKIRHAAWLICALAVIGLVWAGVRIYSHCPRGARPHLGIHPGDPSLNWFIWAFDPDGRESTVGAWKTCAECEASIKIQEEVHHLHGSKCFKDQP